MYFIYKLYTINEWLILDKIELIYLEGNCFNTRKEKCKSEILTRCRPPVCRVQLGGDHIQRVPGGDTEAVVETEHEDHHRLAGAEPKEEAADARQHHGASCRTRHDTSFISQTQNSLIRRRRQNKGCYPWSHYVIPNMLRRPILSMSRAETMFPGSTASVPRKLTK